MKKTQYKRKQKRKTQRRKTGGKKRIERIIVNLSRKHTSPNIQSDIQVIRGPTEIFSDLGGFISSLVDPVEEEIVSLKMGRVKPPYHKKEFKFIYDDEETPVYEGQTTALKRCPKKTKKCTEIVVN
jgi:hypothetical protein